MTTQTFRYQAVFPSDNQKVTRKSKRIYSHAWRIIGTGKNSGKPTDISGFASSLARARAAINRELAWIKQDRQEIVDVTTLPPRNRPGAGMPTTIPHFLKDWTFTAHNDQFHGWTHPDGAITVQGDPTRAGKSWSAFHQAPDDKCTWLKSIKTGDRRKFSTAESCARAAVTFWLGAAPAMPAT